MKNLPFVSIVIVNYNGERFLSSCLSALFNLNYPKEKREIILVDNGSTDASVLLIQTEFKNKVKFIQNDKNNYCKANNLGISVARGKYVAFLNIDAVVDKDWLLELVKVMESDKKIAAAGGKILYPDGKISTVGHFELPNFYWGEEGAGEETSAYPDMREKPSICGAAVLYRKEIFEKIGGFDEDFIMYMEDIDMGFRIRKLGYKLLYVPSAVVYHYVHGCGDYETSRYYIERNRLLFLAKHFPSSLPSSLLGNGYFTVQKGLKSMGSIYQIIPDIIMKLVKHHSFRQIDPILKKLFEELKKIVNFENDILRKKLNEKILFLQEKEKEGRNFRHLLEQLKVNLEQEKGKIKALETELDKLKLEVALKNQIVAKSESEKEQMNKIISERHEEFNKILNWVKEETKIKEELIREKDALLKEIAELKEERGEFIREKDALLKEIAKVKEERNDLSKRIGELENKKNMLIERLQLKEEELNKEREKLIANVNDLNSERETLFKEREFLLREVERFKTEKEKLTRDLTNVYSQLKSILDSEGYRYILQPLWWLIYYVRKFLKAVFWIVILGILSGFFLFLPLVFWIEEKVWVLLAPLLKRKIPKRSFSKLDPNKVNISIVIPHYNRIDLLKPCLDAIFSLEEFQKEGNEVIVVDDGSTNNSVEFIQSNYPRVKIVVNKRNMGYGYSCNRGVKAAKNEIVLLLNNDVILTKDALSLMLPHLINERVFAVTPKMYAWDKKTFIWGMNIGDFEEGYLRFYNERDTGYGDRIYQTAPTLYAIGACMLFRKSDFLWLGGFDYLYRPYSWEDIDLSYRAWKRGLKVIYEPQSIVYHKEKGTIGKYNRSIEVKNELTFMWKNFTDNSILFEHFRFLPFIIYNNNLPFLKGFIRALVRFPLILYQRFFKERKFFLKDEKEIFRKTSLYYKNFIKRGFCKQHPLRSTILLISPFFPYPPRHGMQVKIYNTIKMLSKKCDLILLTFTDFCKSEHITELKLYCKDIIMIEKKDSGFNIFQKLIYPEPLMRRFFSKEFVNALKTTIIEYPIDLIMIESSFMIWYSKFIKDIPKVLIEHDASILSFKNSFEKYSSKLFIFRFFEWLKRFIFLIYFYKKFDFVITFTERDKRTLEKLISNIEVCTIPIGLDLDFYVSKKKNKKEKDIDILFIGHFLHYPNIDGLRKFLTDIYPLILNKLKQVDFKIIGSGNLNSEMRELISSKNLSGKFLGAVSDVREYLIRSKLIIVPIRKGGGMKLKVLEAMVMGTPLVAFPEALHGFDIQSIKNLIIANNDLDFANKVVNLIIDEEKRRRVECEFQSLVERKYSNTVIMEKYLRVFQKLFYFPYDFHSKTTIYLLENKNKDETLALRKKNSFPICSVWDLIMRCNYRCPYCFNHGKWEELETYNFVCSLDDFLDFWYRMYKKYGEINITISGGEPFTFPELKELLSILTKFHTIGIVTNLSWDVEYWVDKLDPFKVKIYPSFHPYFVDIKIFLQKLKKLREAGWKYLGVVIVAYPPLLEKLKHYVELIKNEGFYPWVNPFVGWYKGKAYPQAYTKEEQVFLAQISNNFQYVKHQVNNFNTLGKLCHAGELFFRVHPDGKIYRCASIGPIGHIKDKNFSLFKHPSPCKVSFCMCSNEFLYLKGKEEELKKYIYESLLPLNSIYLSS